MTPKREGHSQLQSRSIWATSRRFPWDDSLCCPFFNSTVSLHNLNKFQEEQKFIRQDSEAASRDHFQSNRVCRAKTKACKWPEVTGYYREPQPRVPAAMEETFPRCLASGGNDLPVLQHHMLFDLLQLLSSLNNNDLHYSEGPKGHFNSDFSLRWAESEQNIVGCKRQPWGSFWLPCGGQMSLNSHLSLLSSSSRKLWIPMWWLLHTG